jgi:hypothetical protein
MKKTAFAEYVLMGGYPSLSGLGLAQEKPSATADLATQYRKKLHGCQQKGTNPG